VNIEPSPLVAHVPHNSGEVRLLVAARVDRNKNARKLLEALDAVRNVQPSLRLSVDWYGNQEAEPDTVRETREAISHKNLGGIFRLHEPTDKIHDLMLRADTVVLPSYYEGLPNSICEGMALGKPILMSAVCDAGNLVQDGVSGFLFDPHSPRSIADAIARFVRLTPEERSHMGKASRARAEVLFDVKTVAGRYLRILEAAAERKRLKIEHWPKQVPETALRDSFQRRTT
jgi:glycosyltransferase involved in cell wall biosynthesis